MEFLNSAFSWLLVFSSVPIIIHLLNRQRFKKIRWAAMEFLLAALKKTKRRLQLENIILLIIRTLAVLFFVLCILKTRLTHAPTTIIETKDTLYIIIYDDSFSMANFSEGTTPFHKAQNILKKFLKKVKPEKGDEIHIFVTSRSGYDIVKSTDTIDSISRKVERLEVSDYPADLPSTFEKVKHIIDNSAKSVKKVIIFSDLQKTSWNPDLTVGQKKKFVDILEQVSSSSDVILFNLAEKNIENCAVTELSTNINLIGVGMKFDAIAKISNFGLKEFSNGKLSFYVDGHLSKSEIIPSVLPKNDIEIKFRHQFQTKGAHFVKAVFEDDNLKIDNERYLVLQVREFLNILILDGEFSPRPYEDEVRYLSIALSPDEKSSIFRVKIVGEMEFNDADLFEFDCVVIANAQTLSQKKIVELEEYAKKSGGILFFGGDKVADNVSFYNDNLYKDGKGILPAKLGETKSAQDYQNLVNITKVNFNHPSMKFFKRDRTLFDRLFIEKYHTLNVDKNDLEDGKVEIIAHLSDGELTPVIVEKKIHDGKVIFFGTSADSEWNFMQACEVYVPLMDQIVSYLCTRKEDNFNIEVGEHFEQNISTKEFGEYFSLMLPDNSVQGITPIKIGTSPTEYYVFSFKDTHKKGVYSIDKIKKSGERENFSYFSANLNVDESVLENYSKEDLEKLYPNFKFTLLEKFSEKEEEMLTTPASNIWKYLLYALLGLVLIETVLAQIFSNR